MTKPQKQAVLLLYINPENGQEVLSVSRKDDHKALGLPGGKMEDDETLVNGLIREAKEELNVNLNPHLLEFLYQDWDSGYDTLVYLYKGKITLPQQTPFVNSEGALVEFVPAGALIDPARSPFHEYNLKMFKKFTTSLDFISYQKNNQ